ncbi:MAG: hypothetical protein HY824_05145 [Acidobacteria bacterium]|nr:hypothetical protein [Acidobacteriota bacterium]
MKILFAVSHFGFLRNFEPALRALAAEGHTLRLVADRADSLGGTRTIDNLTAACPGAAITFAYAPQRKDMWQHLAVRLRLCRDYWRYLEPRYAEATSLRARAASQAPALASRLPGLLVGTAAGRRFLHAIVGRCERALPPSPAARELLETERPDVLLVTPLLYFGNSQVDYVRVARQLGIPTVLGVGSWDHLTTKGLLHVVPDRVVVWNEAQRTEAWEIHGVPPDRVSVTGAQAYDDWFTTHSSTTRDAFCARHGFDPSRPIVLYLCSSPFITPLEVPFVRRWLDAVRTAGDDAVRGANVLIRPHPQNAQQWQDVDLSSQGAAIFPRAGANPVDADARREYFDSMFHSVAVVGVNTSALIESGIVGRPVCTIRAAEFEGQQEGTLHFQHLKSVNGGLLHIADDFEQHVGQLARILGDPDTYAARSRAFIAGFVRPHGLDRRAAGLFVEALMQGAAARPAPPPAGRVLDRLIRLLLAPAARAAQAAALRRRKAKKAPVEVTLAG